MTTSARLADLKGDKSVHRFVSVEVSRPNFAPFSLDGLH